MQACGPSLRGSCPASGLPRGPSRPRSSRTRVAAPCAGLGDAFKSLFDFESWAPRSSQAWRLGRSPDQQETGMGDKDVDLLNERLAQARRSGSSIDDAGAGTGVRATDDSAQSSFLASTDDEVADSLNQRIGQVVNSMTPVCLEGEEDCLTGSMLADLSRSKWGKAHDMSFVRRQLPLGPTVVSLSIYHSSLGQRSFPMSEEDYLDKLDGIALCLRTWNQADRVVSFLRQPPKPRGGMPSRPIVGNSVAIALDLDEATIAEWFPQM